MHSMTTAAAFFSIACTFNIACYQNSGFNILAPLVTLLSPLALTASQTIIPNKPYIDMLLGQALKSVY